MTQSLIARRARFTCIQIPTRNNKSSTVTAANNASAAQITRFYTDESSISPSARITKNMSEWKKSGHENVGVYSQTPSEYKLGKHRSNALSLLQQEDVIEVDGDFAVCDGGGGALGHPLEYIKLGVRQDIGEGGWAEGVRCLYCGLRYRSKNPH